MNSLEGILYFADLLFKKTNEVRKKIDDVN